MTKKAKHFSWQWLGILFLAIVVAGCGGNSVQMVPTSQVFVRVYWSAEAADTRLIPENTETIHIEVSAADISPAITDDIPRNEVLGGTAHRLLYIPPGSNRLFIAQAKNAGGTVLGTASATTNVTAGATTTVNLVIAAEPIGQLVVKGSVLYLYNNVTTKTFQIGNTSTTNGTLDWSLAESIPWLTVSPSSGSIAAGGADATVTVTVDRTGMSNGDYSGDITVNSNGGQGWVTVNMSVYNNTAPSITSVVATPTDLRPGAVTTIVCTATDVDGNALAYSWSAAAGTIYGSGSTIRWEAPQAPGTYIISCTVTDGWGGSANRTVSVTVSTTDIIVS